MREGIHERETELERDRLRGGHSERDKVRKRQSEIQTE